MNTKITLYSGNYFDFSDIEHAPILISDIAHALAGTNRFGAQGNKFYSVAQHSIYVSEIVSKENALYGLLHDSEEYVMCDLPGPLKHMLPDYEFLANLVREHILLRYGLENKIPPEVKLADKRIVKNEAFAIGLYNESWGPLELNIEVRPWTPRLAEEEFLMRFEELQE